MRLHFETKTNINSKAATIGQYKLTVTAEVSDFPCSLPAFSSGLKFQTHIHNGFTLYHLPVMSGYAQLNLVQLILNLFAFR